MEYFNIQVAAQVSGVSPHTIRAWEKRYQAIVPKRSENGRRLYSEQDIERLSLLSQLTNFGSSISQVANLNDKELKQLIQKFQKNSPNEFSNIKKSKNLISPDEILKNILMALSTFKLDIISHEMEKARDNLSSEDLALKLILPLFQNVGRKIEAGTFSIAQEHSLSAIVKFHVGQIIHTHYIKKSKHRIKIALATPTDERHAFGILCASLIFCHYNFDVFYLGRDLPAEALAQAANAIRVDYIVLGVSPYYESISKQTLKIYLEELQDKLNEKIKIWIGGDDKIAKKMPHSPQIEFIGSLEELKPKILKLLQP
ncbi:MAG: MerR family transcriptional regulator [Bacteriovoracaceae bacterium]|nr:MerR family transcriptional regulator [Bacteriovoracaceae bacterium]